jgi:hypothetical protein
VRKGENEKYLKIITRKTGEVVMVPIWHYILEELLEEYDYAVPKIWEQKLNQRLKTLGKLAGFDDTVEVERLKGGLKVKSTLKKHELIMTHTARRSGATIMYLKGIPPIDIMKITGHRTEKNFLKYIKVTKEETASKILRSHRVERPMKVI